MVEANIKSLSQFLARNLKDSGVKQSQLLELMAQFNGFKDWNALSANLKDVDDIDFSEVNRLNWTNPQYLHIDNGGLTISYNPFNQMMKFECGFFGYSSHVHCIKMKFEDIDNLIKDLENPQNPPDLWDDVNAVESVRKIVSGVKVSDSNLVLKTETTEFSISLMAIKQELIDALKRIKGLSQALKEIRNAGLVAKMGVAKSDVTPVFQVAEKVSGIYLHGVYLGRRKVWIEINGKKVDASFYSLEVGGVPFDIEKFLKRIV